MRKKYIARTGIALMIVAFITGSRILLYNSGGWIAIGQFWSLLVFIFLTAFAIKWCIENYNL
jgi:hypothetical protein